LFHRAVISDNRAICDELSGPRWITGSQGWKRDDEGLEALFATGRRGRSGVPPFSLSDVISR
jgi:hypothetical protein